MPRKLPPFVERNHVKGHTYLSFRRGRGARIRLPNDPTSEEFQIAYRAALFGFQETPRPNLVRTPPGSIAALIASYMRSPTYLSLRESTKIGYASRIEALREQHGHRPVAGLTRERIEKGILSVYSSRPGAKLSILKMLRILIAHAIRLDTTNPCHLDNDPSIGIKRPKINEFRAWTDAELAAFERRWPVGTKQRTAYALMLYVGTARADVHKITWSQLDGGAVAYVRSKTGVKIDGLDVHSELQRALAVHPRIEARVRRLDGSDDTILKTEYGKPFTADGFSGFMRKAMEAAGLPLDCKPHGLRKTLGRRLADAGATPHEIMAVLGHTTLAEAERYTREANRRRGGSRAIAKLEAHTANADAQTVLGRLGIATKNEGKSK